MNGAGRRQKGQAGERELFALLSDRLGFSIRRNVDQARAGGADGLDIPGWAVECKRCETLAVSDWWAQACAQAARVGRRPILAYRQSRRDWAFVFDGHDVCRATWPVAGRARLSINIDGACDIIRESLGSREGNGNGASALPRLS